MPLYHYHIFKLLSAARMHERYPFDERHAETIDDVLTQIDDEYGWGEVLYVISYCDQVVDGVFGPLPQWVNDILSSPAE